MSSLGEMAKQIAHAKRMENFMVLSHKEFDDLMESVHWIINEGRQGRDMPMQVFSAAMRLTKAMERKSATSTETKDQ